MTLTRGVVLPSSTAVGGGILAQARPLPEGWERGLGFATEACLIAGEHVFCVDSPTDKDFQGTELAEFHAYGVEVSVVCTTLTGTRANAEREARAASALSIIAEFSVGLVLATGDTAAGVDTDNPSLADATDVGNATTVAEAISILEGQLALGLRGHLGWIHITPQDLVTAFSEQAVYLDDLGNWRTPSGHLVVASPGYTEALAGVVVATTEVFASRGEIDLVRTVDRSDNRYLAVHEAPALAVFDPCFNVSIDLPAASPP